MIFCIVIIILHKQSLPIFIHLFILSQLFHTRGCWWMKLQLFYCNCAIVYFCFRFSFVWLSKKKLNNYLTIWLKLSISAVAKVAVLVKISLVRKVTWKEKASYSLSIKPFQSREKFKQDIDWHAGVVGHRWPLFTKNRSSYSF